MKNDLTTEQLAQPITVTLPLSAVLRLAESEPIPAQFVAAAHSLPAIGSAYDGGIYAGQSIEIGNNRAVALVLLPGDEKMNWNDAKAWAEKQGGSLPSRVDQLVLFANLKAEFKKDYYWSGEQYAGYEGCAWSQNFDDGCQYCSVKANSLRARAVRRLVIPV